jgi:predicted secreted protein
MLGALATVSLIGSTTPAARATTVAVVEKIVVPSKARSVSGRVGDTFQVKLVDCATCGFRWEVATPTDTKIVRLVSHVYAPPNLPKGMVGGSGTAVFTFRAVALGSTSVTLGYYGPGSPRPAASSRYTLKFRITPDP